MEFRKKNYEIQNNEMLDNPYDEVNNPVSYTHLGTGAGTPDYSDGDVVDGDFTEV